ncbi:MAG: hypothetical protein GY842_22615, partial [bacterium]|nr:hypothetical protein [bacterium]
MSEPDLNFGDREFLLSRYLDGDLDAAERRELESTLRTDPELAELLEGYRRVDRLVRSQHAPAPELDWERFAFEVRRRCATPRLQTKRPVYY